MSPRKRLARPARALAALLVGPVVGLGAVAAPPDAGLVERGRRIYEDGILPDGSPLRASRPEGFVLEGPDAACATCHRRSGMGSVEGSADTAILVPPVVGRLLFQPARFHRIFLDPSHHWVPNASWARALTRAAYDEPSLARALRDGLDPDGRQLVAPMPRYELDTGELSALVAHVRGLASDPPPGVEADVLRLATVVTPDAAPGHAEAVVGVLQAWSAFARPAGKRCDLQVWELSGPPADWEQQLEARYREQPVFALLSGAGGAEWMPVHRFCERRRVPCILPSVEVAPEADGDLYSVYYSPGVVLEARLLARAVEGVLGADGGRRRIVQVFSDASGMRAAEAFASDASAGGRPPEDRRYHLTAPAAALAGLSSDDAVILWLRPPEIETLAAALPQGPAAGRVFLSALLAPPEAVSLPPAWKAFAVWVSLFDDLGVQGQIARLRLEQWLEQAGLPRGRELRVAADAYAASYLLTSALQDIRGEEVRRPAVPLGREHLLEALEVEVTKYSDGTPRVDPDSHVAFYGRMSLGPGQRTAVRGGALLRYASPDSDELVAASPRIVR